MKRTILYGIVLCVTLMSMQCSAPRSTTHPSKPILTDKTTLGIVPLGYNLIIHNDKLFASRLSIQREYLHQNLLTTLSPHIQETLTALLAHPIHVLPPNSEETFPPAESYNIQSTTYLKTRWPAQGVALIASDSVTPDYILFFHEINIGINLQGDQLYDYRKSSIESESVNTDIKQQSGSLSVVINYSLWDNKRQHYVVMGYVDAHDQKEGSPINRSTITQLVDAALVQVIQKCPLKKHEVSQ